MNKALPQRQSRGFNIAELQALLSVFKRTLGALYRRETLSMQCSISHLEIMQYIHDHRNPTMKEVANHLEITPPSVTTLIDAMEEHGLVRRKIAPGDRRSVRVILTPKASKLYGTLQKKKAALLKVLLAKLTVEQKQNLADIIRTMVN